MNSWSQKNYLLFKRGINFYPFIFVSFSKRALPFNGRSRMFNWRDTFLFFLLLIRILSFDFLFWCIRFFLFFFCDYLTVTSFCWILSYLISYNFLIGFWLLNFWNLFILLWIFLFLFFKQIYKWELFTYLSTSDFTKYLLLLNTQFYFQPLNDRESIF